MSDNVTQNTEILVNHGRNTSDRLVQKILLSFYEFIDGKEIEVDGKKHRLKPLGVSKQNDAFNLLFDVKDVEGFDHIEFKVSKTGWGRSCEIPREGDKS